MKLGRRICGAGGVDFNGAKVGGVSRLRWCFFLPSRRRFSFLLLWYKKWVGGNYWKK